MTTFADDMPIVEENIGALHATGFAARPEGDDTVVNVHRVWMVIVLLLSIVILILLILLFVRSHKHKNQSNEPADCIKIKKLPYTMDKDGACYKFVKNLVWAGSNAAALSASGRDMKLYCQRHNLTITDQYGQGLLVFGTEGMFGPDAPHAGSLRTYDCNFYAADFLYSIFTFAATVETGGVLEMQHTTVHNIAWGAQNFNGLLKINNFNFTGEPFEDSADREAVYLAGDLSFFPASAAIFNFGMGTTLVEDIQVRYDKHSADGESLPGPILDIGIYESHAANPCTGLFCDPGVLNARDVTIFADGGIVAIRSKGLDLRNINIEICEDLAAPNQLGMLLACGNPERGIVDGVTINMQNAGFASAGITIVGTTGMLVRDAILTGRTLPGFDFISAATPYLAWHGLLNVQVFEDSPFSHGAWFDHFTINATDTETYCITAGTAAISDGSITGFDPCNTLINARFTNGIVSGGAVGLLIGQSMGDYTQAEDVVFSNNTVGVYVRQLSENTRLLKNSLVWECVGLLTELAAGNVGSQFQYFSSNNFNIVDNAGSVLENNDQAFTDSEVECFVPEFLDSCETIILETDTETYAAAAAEFGPVPPLMNVTVPSMRDDAENRIDRILAAKSLSVASTKKRAAPEFERKRSTDSARRPLSAAAKSAINAGQLVKTQAKMAGEANRWAARS